MNRSYWRSLVGLAAVTLAAACGTSEGTGPGGGGGSISINLSKTTLTVQQGGSDNLTASITRAGGFTGDVTIATTGAPSGVTAVASNVSTSGGTTTGTITVSVAASVAPGSYPLTVTASGNGVTSVQAQVTLNVTALPAIALSLSPTALSVAQGASGNTAATITRTNFTGEVAFTATGAPQGVTVTFAPTSTSGTASTITVQVGAGAALGQSVIAIRASGTGVATADAQLTVTVTEPPSYTLAAANVQIAQSAFGNVPITLTRTNFTGSVDLTITGLPQGVTAQFAPASVAGTSSTLTLTVGAAVPVGDYPLVVRGAAQGLAERTANFTLTVIAGVQGSYTLSTTPASPISIQQAGQTNVTVNINRTGGFAGSVALSAADAPGPVGSNSTRAVPGITFQFNPANTTGNSSTLTIQVTGSVAVGSYGFVITGTATGLTNQQINVTVTVTTASSGGNVTLDFRACFQPIWVGYQDGSGAWAQAQLSNGVYRFNIASATGAYAYVLNLGLSYVTSIHYHTQAELIGLTGLQLCGSTPSGKTLLGTTANITTGYRATTSLGGSSTTSTPGSPSITLNNVPNGTHDLISYMQAVSGVGTGDRVIARRDINTTAIASGGSIGPVLDFASSEAKMPAVAAINLTNTGGDNIIAGVTLFTTAACEAATLYTGANLGAATTVNAYLLPGSSVVGTDYHSINLTAADAGNTTFRTVTQSFAGATPPSSVALGSQMPALTPTTLSGPYKRLQFQATLPTDLSFLANAQYSNQVLEGGFIKTISMIATGGFLGGSTVNLSAPDLTGAGYNATWAPSTALDWSLAGVSASPTSSCTNGARFVLGQRRGTA